MNAQSQPQKAAEQGGDVVIKAKTKLKQCHSTLLEGARRRRLDLSDHDDLHF